MFGFFGKKTLKIAAPLEGKIIDITAVSDEVFSQKMMGDGFAVEPAPGRCTVTAPCDGEVTMLAETGHAVYLKADGADILIHAGVNTAELDGEGFTALVTAGSRVKKGDKLISFDGELIKGRGKEITTMLVITGTEGKKLKRKNLQDRENVLELE